MLAIIPARGGSKGILNKNIKLFVGKPLIIWTIEAAIKAKQVDRIVLSSDDKTIINVCRNTGVECPFIRPKELAQDNSLAIETYIYTVERLKNEFGAKIDEFVVLLPTCPLRLAVDIDNAINIFYKKHADSVISLFEATHPPLWSKKISQYGKITDYFNTKIGNKNRQELDKAYLPNGAVFVFKYILLKERYSYYSDKTYPYIMPKERSIDIDSLIDFEFAEFLMRKRNNL